MPKRILQLVFLVGLCFFAPPASAQTIHEAAGSGDAAAVRAFVESDTDVDVTNEDGFTALHLAARLGHTEVIEALLSGGADINRPHETSGLSAVDFAFQSEAARETAETTALLVSRGAKFEPDATIRGPFTRFDLAVSTGNAEMTRLLLSLGAEATTDTSHPRPRLLNAATSGNAEIAEMLLDAGVSVNQTDRDGNPALRYAIEKGHPQVVSVLLEHGADLEFVDAANGRNLLHVAALAGHDDVAALLLNKGVPVDTRDGNDRTPIYYAAKYGHRTLADRLRDHGATRPEDLQENYGRSSHMTRELSEGEAVAWYLNNRGWALRTSNNVVVFDAEEWGVTRPADPSLANGFVTPLELGDNSVLGLYTCYHGEIGEPAYLHAIEDSLSNVTYIQNAGDRWRGSERSVYLSPLQDTTIGDVRITTIEVTEEMTSLGYLVQVDGLTIYYAGFRAEELNNFEQGLDYLNQHVQKVDIAFLPLIEADEDESDYKAFLHRLNPSAVFVLDPNRREEEYGRMREKAFAWGFEPRVYSAENPGDVFVFRR